MWFISCILFGLPRGLCVVAGDPGGYDDDGTSRRGEDGLDAAVATVDAYFRAGHEARCVAREEDDGALDATYEVSTPAEPPNKREQLTERSSGSPMRPMGVRLSHVFCRQSRRQRARR